MDGHFRLGFGVEQHTLEEGLSRIGHLLRSL
jgi:bifunctional pyridoxal-dependent enzyme with beta-cystathionase and maltose regulon repressor activities